MQTIRHHPKLSRFKDYHVHDDDYHGHDDDEHHENEFLRFMVTYGKIHHLT